LERFIKIKTAEDDEYAEGLRIVVAKKSVVAISKVGNPVTLQ
jgi:hypothetical protein